MHLSERNLKNFWNKVTKLSNQDCWEWTACLQSNGYGQIRFDNKVHYSHRLSYFIHFGHIPEDKHVLHRCDNRKCVNPLHLFLGDQASNMADCAAKRRNAHGTRSPLSKITEQQLAEIRRLSESGCTCKYISNKYNLHYNTIYKILKGVTYKHVTDNASEIRKELP